MITIEQARLDFRMSNETFATDLYGKWDSLYPTLLEKVIDEVLCRYDREDEVIRLESVGLDLGEIEEPEFYRQFPKKLAEKLDEFFADCLNFREKYPIEIIPIYKDKTGAMLFFLLNGFFPQGTPAEYRDIAVLLKEVVENNGSEFVRLLKARGNIPSIRERLAYQFSDADLEAIVKVAEPSEAMFIQVYVRYLIVSHGRMRHPEITAQDHRNAVWQVVLAYLLYDSGSFFSRKQMVWQTVRGLAAHFNIDFLYLLQLLTAGLKKFTEEWVLVPELLAIFSDLQQEAVREELPEIKTVTDLIHSAENVTPADCSLLCRLLSRPDSCRLVLAGLKEEEIVRVVEWIVPAESPFIVDYARGLDREKERGLLEGKAGSEFRLLKWEFLFLVLLDSPVSFFQRARFVMAVVHRIARHYNLDALVLLAFLCADSEGLPVRLAEVLKELYEAQINGRYGEVLNRTGEISRKESELSRLTAILSHPVTARRFLQNLPDIQIYRLTEIVIPAESVFIISYAQSLDREKEKGLLEGKAGTEFRLLKWEFIFLVVLSAPVSAFSRKYFVRSVLWQLAAHYNLATHQLLNYFFREEIKSGLPEDLQQIIAELWEEETMQSRRRETDINLYVENLFLVLSKRREISEQMWESAGIEFVVGLLQSYRRPEVSEFIRKWKRQVWNLLFGSVKHTEILCEKIVRTPGLWNYLTAEYGEENLVTAIVEKKPDWNGWKECSPEGWKAVWKAGDMVAVFWWLNHKPEDVRRMWRQCSLTEERQLLKVIAGDVELQKIWIDRMGEWPVRQVWEVLMELKKIFSFFPAERVWLVWLIPYTGKRYANFSSREILNSVWQKITAFLSEETCTGMIQSIKKQTVNSKLKILEIMEQEKNLAGEEFWQNGMESSEFGQERNEGVHFDTPNAGIVVLAPYLRRLFGFSNLLKGYEFKDVNAWFKAIGLIQYVTNGREEFQESELNLSKLLVGLKIEQEVPSKIQLTEEERNLCTSMLEAVKENWSVLRNTSIPGIQNAFFVRKGILTEYEDRWELRVEERPYDVLLEKVPWNFSIVKFPWMEKMLYVKWRN